MVQHRPISRHIKLPDPPITAGTYVYNANGSGVRAYVVDGGVRTSHSQVGGRASIAADYIGTDG